MGYEKPSTTLTFYKAFFSVQWKFLIHTILQCMSTKRTAWNEFSSSMASAVICLAAGRKFNFSKYIFDSLVRNVDSPLKFYMYLRFLQLMINAQIVDLSSHTTKHTSPALTQKVFANMRRVEYEDATNEISAEPTPPSPTPATPPPPQQDIIPSPSQEVGKEEKVERFRVKEIKEGEKIAELDADEDVTLEEVDAEKDVEVQERLEESQAQVYHLDLKHAQKVLSMQEIDEAEPAEVKEVLEVVTAAKLMTEVVTTATTPIIVAPVPKASAPRRRRSVIIQDPKEAATASLSEELKTHLQIVPNDEDDVCTETTPLALKVSVVDYQIHTEHNKPYYKIIRADGFHQLFLSFIGMLRNFDKEDLEMLWKIVQEKFASSKPKNFSDYF
nr:hypothetical protein [Tanacetum cinerariifolium]